MPDESCRGALLRGYGPRGDAIAAGMEAALRELRPFAPFLWLEANRPVGAVPQGAC
ncbi:MAG: hypothetical protein HY906_16720 [Deltaproteobacteria bacterium]|nr:hypothetical protein [Deltaproteobacteria bacterium]